MGIDTKGDIDIPLNDNDQLHELSKQLGLTVEELQMARHMSTQEECVVAVEETSEFVLTATDLTKSIEQAVAGESPDVSKILQRDYPPGSFNTSPQDEADFHNNRDKIVWGPPPYQPGDFITPFHLPTHLKDPEDYVCKDLNERIRDELSLTPLTSAERGKLISVIFGTPFGSQVNRVDVIKWLRHPIAFLNERTNPTVMMQLTGGPCGVIASVQAVLMQRLLFTGPKEAREVAFPTPFLLAKAFADALALIIRQATPEDQKMKLVWIAPVGRTVRSALRKPVDFGFASLAMCSTAYDMHESEITQWDDILAMVPFMARAFESVEELRLFILRNIHLLFCAPRTPGILNIVASVALSRGCHEILTEDFEGASDRALLSLFGHCSQELVNLLLLGRASANLFDGDKVLGGSDGKLDDISTVFVLRGAPRRGLVGYLNQMEALRYCEVGDYLKSPFFPIWVLGSSDHFTVLWCLDRSSVQITEHDLLEHLAKGVFHKLDEDETGLLKTTDLHHLLKGSAFDDRTVLQGLRKLGGGEVVLRNDFIDFFITHRDQSGLWTKMDATEKFRLLRGEEPSRRGFVLFHLDNQVTISRGNNDPTVSAYPFLSCLEMRQLECGHDESQDKLSQILGTRWGQPLKIRRVSSSYLRSALSEMQGQTCPPE